MKPQHAEVHLVFSFAGCFACSLDCSHFLIFAEFVFHVVMLVPDAAKCQDANLERERRDEEMDERDEMR